jgi:ferredoxin
MQINCVKLIYFSPTRTTRKILEGIAQGIQVDTVEHVDLTSPEARTQEFEELHDELAIIGAPVYGGRIPNDAVQRLLRLEAQDTPAVLVVVYGNRAYEDALLELTNLAKEAGFRPVAGGAFIGEHSYDNVLDNGPAPIADGRPDKEDLMKAMAFGQSIQKKVRDILVLDEISPLRFPGNYPYKERGYPPRITPVTQDVLCSKCEECVAACPTAAITMRDTVVTDLDAFIAC